LKSSSRDVRKRMCVSAVMLQVVEFVIVVAELQVCWDAR
jgi:hypothetical protein